MTTSALSEAPASTVHQAFARTARQWPRADFVHIPAPAAAAYSDAAITLSYGEAAASATALAAAYRNAGVCTGQRVALLLDNRPAFFVHWLALNALGAAIVPLNAEASAAELAHVLRDSGAVLAVVLPSRRPLLEAVWPLLPAPLPVHEVGAAVPALGTDRPATASADECALVYTSGSTGAPKGCMLSNRYFLDFGAWYLGIGGLCRIEPGRERLITPLPLTHMNALACSTLVMVLSGGCIVQLDRFHPRQWWQEVAESRATIVHYLGVMPALLLQLPASPQDRGHALRFGFGAGVHPTHHAAFETRFGFPLVESWSMTEVGAGGAVIAHAPPRHLGTRCFGRPSAAVAVQLVDAQGRPVARGEPGELWVHAAGPDPRRGFFSGYANQPALTEAAWAGGWFHTGDVVREADDGSLHFVDRRKSIVRRSGENIASLEVESALNQLPFVRAVGVGPVDDELRGEEVMACLTLMPGEPATAETAQRVFEAVRPRLSYFKLPGYVAFVEALPLTPSQKLQRGELRTLGQRLVDQGLAFDLRHLKKRPAAEAGQ